MKTIGKVIACIALLLACLGYTFYNYSRGRIDIRFLIVASAILIFPLFNLVRSLISGLNDKD